MNSVSRSNLSTNLNGIHENNDDDILKIVETIKKQILQSPGPIHLNIPFEKPLDISLNNKKKNFEVFERFYLNKTYQFLKNDNQNKNIQFSEKIFKRINLSNPGIIIVGPYQGSTKDLDSFNSALKKLQEITGWPVLVDPVSGVSAELRGLVENWELILKTNKNIIQCDQILRLGPLSSSNDLEDFLLNFEGLQILVKENNIRKLDPIKKSLEYDFGIRNFVNQLLGAFLNEKNKSKPLINLGKILIKEGAQIKEILKEQVEKVIISDRLTDTPCCVVTSQFGWSANMERIMKSQALSDGNSMAYMAGKKNLEINPRHPIITEIKDKLASEDTKKVASDLVRLLYDTSLVHSGFTLDDPSVFSHRIFRIIKLGLGLDDDQEPAEESTTTPSEPVEMPTLDPSGLISTDNSVNDTETNHEEEEEMEEVD